MSEPQAEPAAWGPEGGGALLRLVADSVPALIAYYDNESPLERCRFANRRYAEYTGWNTQTIIGKTVREVIGEAAYQAAEPNFHQVRAGHPAKYVREQTLPDGGTRMIEVNLVPHLSVQHKWMGTFVLIHDITEAWQVERAMRDSETRMRKFAEATEEGIYFHRKGIITDVNAGLLRMSGYSLSEVIGRPLLDLIAPAWHQTVLDYFKAGKEHPYELTFRHKDGHDIPVEAVGKTMPFDGEDYRLVVVRDITARKQAQARIEFLALHDPLTQLPNRIYLGEHLTKILALSKRQGTAVAVLFIDLDKFKEVNDLQGHQAGDDLLREIAARLKATVRASDFVARLGGDEFLVVLTDIDGKQEANRVADTLLETLSIEAAAEGSSVMVTPSIGISRFPEHGRTADELIQRADDAMYQAKAKGGRNYQFYHPARTTGA